MDCHLTDGTVVARTFETNREAKKAILPLCREFGLEPPSGVRYIYFVRALPDGPIKIGSAIDFGRRFREIQSLCWLEIYPLLVMRGSFAEERKLHARFDHLLVRGEWFRASREIFDYINSVDDGMPLSGFLERDKLLRVSEPTPDDTEWQKALRERAEKRAKGECP